jgi:hypothetical protein
VWNSSTLLQGTGQPSGPPQLRILRRRQPRVNTTPAHIDRMFQHLPRLRRAPSFAAPCKLPDFLRISKRELPGERSLQVQLEELDLPS